MKGLTVLNIFIKIFARQVFHREKEKWMREINRMKAAQELERKEFERQKYIFTVSRCFFFIIS